MCVGEDALFVPGAMETNAAAGLQGDDVRSSETHFDSDVLQSAVHMLRSSLHTWT